MPSLFSRERLDLPITLPHTHPLDVCLVYPPYSSITHPSLGIELVNQYIQQQDLSCEVVYANMLWANRIGLRHNQKLIHAPQARQTAEWTFAGAAFPEHAQSQLEAMEKAPGVRPALQEIAHRVRPLAPRFVQEVVQAILARNPTVVGCSSTFQQSGAALAILRMVKKQRPEVVTLLGGANCEGDMGQAMVDNFSFIDYAFSGDADEAIGPFIKRVHQEGLVYDHLPYGVLVNREKAPIPKGKAVPRASIKDFSKVGTPNYQVYFDYIDHLDLHADIVPGLPMETSRGCWWGAIQHCTFCAFHENGLSYQAKPAERVLEEWAAMAKKYNHRNIMVVDAILPHEYFETLLPKLAEMGAPYQLFFEIKSNLKQHQVELLAKAGVRWLQPGIESVHDEALAAVKKGVKGIHNVATLKWARAYGIHIAWNVLHGMPLEEDHWYSDMAKIFPSLTHLSPPNGLTSILFQRNSPYFDQSEQYGLELHAAPGYGQVFPLPQQELDRLAYHFHAQDSFRRSARTKASEAKTILADELNTWKALWEREYPPILYQVEREGRICIWDTRPVTEQDYFTKTGIEADLLKICDTPQLAKNVYKKAMERNSGYSESQIEEALHLLQEEHLVLGISGRYISLPVSGPMPFPDKRLLYPGGIVRYYRS